MTCTENSDGVSQERPFESWMKGMPSFEGHASSSDISALSANVLGQLVSLPCAIVKDSALRQNEQWMAEFTRRAGVKLCPHGKTSMSPELFARQIANGAWGISAATSHQVRVMRAHGIKRILYANQIVDPTFISYIADELARDVNFEFYCLVDSVRGAEILAQHYKCSSRPLNVLLEIGQNGARTGVRTAAQALEVARTIDRNSTLLLSGVETYEFSVAGEDTTARESNMARLFRDFVAIAGELDGCGLIRSSEIILSAGGSSYFDLAASAITSVRLSRPAVPVIRSGCYLTSDDLWLPKFMRLMRSRSSIAASIPGEARAAIEVWAYIHSRPEPTQAFLSLGKRDVSYDVQLPRPIYWYRPGTHHMPVPITDGTSIEALNDQHAFLRVPAESPLGVGDMVAVGIAHPCTTFDKWRALLVVDDHYNVIRALSTFF